MTERHDNAREAGDRELTIDRHSPPEQKLDGGCPRFQ
jgi:hypothetical protein